jgi:hypothetical protein
VAAAVEVMSQDGGGGEAAAVPVAVPDPPAAESPFGGDVSVLGGEDFDGAELQALHVRSQELIRALESALDLAKSQEERISRLMER